MKNQILGAKDAFTLIFEHSHQSLYALLFQTRKQNIGEVFELLQIMLVFPYMDF